MINRQGIIGIILALIGFLYYYLIPEFMIPAGLLCTAILLWYVRHNIAGPSGWIGFALGGLLLPFTMLWHER